MTPNTLRVRASGTALVQDHERLDAGTRAYVGRRMEERKDRPGEYGFAPTGEVAEIPYRPEYIHALQAGDLMPADDATADAAGLTLTPRPSGAPNALRDLTTKDGE